MHGTMQMEPRDTPEAVSGSRQLWKACLPLGLAIAVALAFASTPGAAPDFRVAAAAGALFFAIHPLRVESVAWATERRDVLSACFYLFAVLMYLQMHSADVGRRQRTAWYALSVGCFTLS